MKTINRDCIKLLAILFCAVLAFGCKKNDVGENKEDLGEDSPVAIRLSVGNPSYVMTTKAAVEEWNESDLHVFGMKRARGTVVGQNVYDFDDVTTNIVDYKTTALSGTTAVLEVFSDEVNRVPFYYTDGYVYDFYGYHLGNATATDKTVSGDVWTYKITFDGSDDLMYATTDKADDIRKSGNASATVSDVYSSWAARRSIQPTLNFKHALARFNFIVKGKGNKFSDVIITGVDVKSVNTGVLTVVGPQIGFEPAEGVAMATLSLKDADGTDLDEVEVEENTSNNHLGGNGACLMAAPDMEMVEVILHMKHKTNGTVLDDYKFVAKASEVVLKDEGGNKVDVTAFEAGKSYNFIINVYGPEEIIVTAELAEWISGGDFIFDPDEDFAPGEGGSGDSGDDGNEDEEDVVELPEGVESTFSVPSGGGNVEIPIRTNQDSYEVKIPSDVDWISVVETKAIRNGAVVLNIKENKTSSSRSATVTISASNCKIEVGIHQDAAEVEDDVISVTEVKLSAASLELFEGDTQTLTATVNPSNASNKNVTWTSDNPSVAAVNNGVVTAVSAGTATITVTTVDGSKTATCTVTVNAKVYPVSSVSLDKTSATLTEGETVTLSATVNPSNASNKNVTWTSDNPSVAAVNNGVVTAVSAGTATITVTTVDGSKTATCTVTVNAKQNEGNENVGTNPGNGQFQ